MFYVSDVDIDKKKMTDLPKGLELRTVSRACDAIVAKTTNQRLLLTAMIITQLLRRSPSFSVIKKKVENDSCKSFINLSLIFCSFLLRLLGSYSSTVKRSEISDKKKLN